MRLCNFYAEEVAALYAQHTTQTGQRFEPDSVTRAPGPTSKIDIIDIKEVAGPGGQRIHVFGA